MRLALERPRTHQGPARGRILIVFADGKLRRELLSMSRDMAEKVQTAFSVLDAFQLCREQRFDVMLLVGEAWQVAEAKKINALGGWTAAMPIVAVCSGSLDLAEARAAGISVLIPNEISDMAVWGALRGALAPDSRNATWWVD